jgi:fibronectin type 3 domain-containing protein
VTRRYFIQIILIPLLMLSMQSPATTTHSVALSWKESNQSVNYRVWRSDTAGGPYTMIASAITKLTWTDKRVTSKATYYYVVDARNTTTNLTSEKSNEVKVVIL